MRPRFAIGAPALALVLTTTGCGSASEIAASPADAVSAAADVCAVKPSLVELSGVRQASEATRYAEEFSALADELLELRGLDAEVDELQGTLRRAANEWERSADALADPATQLEAQLAVAGGMDAADPLDRMCERF